PRLLHTSPPRRSSDLGLSLVISITVIPAAARLILKKHSDGGGTVIDSGFLDSPDDANAKLGFFGRINFWFANFIYKLMTLPGGIDRKSTRLNSSHVKI